MTVASVCVAKTKSYISELIIKIQCLQEIFIFTRRNKPVAILLVSLDDLEIFEQQEEKQGLAAIAGQWQGFEEITEAMGALETLRANGGKGRNVSL